MENKIVIHITNGGGSTQIVNGNYNITSSTLGYDDTTIDPAAVEITDATEGYDFMVGATGVLTLHVSDDGTDAGVPIVGAKFARCDAEGKIYGDEVISDDSGNAVFNHVPFSAEENAPVVYYKQTASDGQHTFAAELKNTTLAEEAVLVELQNEEAVLKNFKLTDLNYSGLPIADGQIHATVAE